MIEGENIIDLNPDNIHFYGKTPSEEKSTKIISDSSEFIPICSIPKIVCVGTASIAKRYLCTVPYTIRYKIAIRENLNMYFEIP